jgi:HEAT repeat protein
MNKRLLLLLVLGAALLDALASAPAPDSNDEQQLVQVLQSSASPAEKDAACARLKFIGTRRCVPALAALLTDEQLSHSARYALEPMPFPEAGAALLDALAKTKGLIRIGLINSLAARAEIRAVPVMVQLLRDPEVSTASASAGALGRIGGSESVNALRNCAHDSTGPVHSAAVDGLLRCANRMLASGERASALAIFEQLDAPGEPDHVQAGAFNGRVRASADAGLALVSRAIAGPSGPNQVAALQMVRDLSAAKATKELAGLLPRLDPPVQLALVEGLAQRGDPAALPAFTSLIANSSPDVQLAILQGLKRLGDASTVRVVLNFAASGNPEEQKASREALTELRRGDVVQALVAQLETATPQVQAEAARALGARDDKAAVPKLLELAQRGPDSARRAALRALSELVVNSQLPPLVDLVLRARDPAARAEAAEAVNSAYQHLQAERQHPPVDPLVQGIATGVPEARVALLPVCGGINDPKTRAILRKYLGDNDPHVRAAAVRSLSDTTDPELLPDLLQLASTTDQEAYRALAIAGAVRLVTQEESVKMSTGPRVAALGALLRAATQPEQKRQVLAGLAEVPDAKALRAVDTQIDDPNLHNEAARAAVRIALALPGNQAEEVAATLKRALAAATDPATHQAVQAALKQIQDNSEYLTDWEVAGPYRLADKDYAALFDIAFPPESPAGAETKWTALAPGSDATRPWLMDLLKAVGGQQCVAYARTWIHSDQQRDAVLELGSDDGVKVWLNDNQVYALNVARPLQPGSDKVNVRLKAGWNPLLLKITQNNLGWEFCARLRNADGSPLGGVRCESAPSSVSAVK